MDTTNKQTGSSEEKNWQEKIADKVASDNKLLDSIIKLLTNPLVFLIMVLAVGYWYSKKQTEKNNGANTTPAEELKKIKKKHKKLKKRYRDSMSSVMNANKRRSVNFD